MTLKDIKILCLKNDITMSELSRKLSISREWMYIRIKQKHPETLNKIKKILK